MKLYIVKTKYNTLQYYRRVPKKLLKYVGVSKVRVGLGTEKENATKIALQYNKSIEEALHLIKEGVEEKIIISTIRELIPNNVKEIVQDSVLFSSTVDRCQPRS